MRARSGQDLINDSYERADVEGESDRFPRPSVLRYVNQGGAELWDIIVKARGRSFCRSTTPWTITTLGNTILYTVGYPTDFYQLLGVRLDGDYAAGIDTLLPYEEAYFADAVITGTLPSHYDLRPNGLALFPRHSANLTVVVDYVKGWLDLTDSPSSNFDGINGWEEYIVCFAARCIARKDDDRELAQSLTSDMAALASRIGQLAPQRDKSQARRVRDVRGPRLWNNVRSRWWLYR